jgi:hypothetical protein
MGEAFNAADDQASPPWSFLEIYWTTAVDQTSGKGLGVSASVGHAYGQLR